MSSAVIPIIISSLSLIAGLLALYFSQLRAPSLKVYFGRKLQLYYPRDGGFGLYIPITIVNESVNTGTVMKCSLLLTKEGENESYYMEWNGFASWSEKTEAWETEEIANPVVIPGRSSISKVVWYVWRPYTKPELHLTSGVYTFRLVFFASEKPKPRFADFQKINFPPKIISLLDERREKHDPMSIILYFSYKFGENAVLSREQLRNLKSLLR